MNIMIVDGQGGGIGSMLVEQLKQGLPHFPITALGTNAVATSTMLKAGADKGATGENAIVYNSPEADIIIGSVAIVVANSLLGEITPLMAKAIAESRAQRILLPINKCCNLVVGVQQRPIAEYVELAVAEVNRIAKTDLS